MTTITNIGQISKQHKLMINTTANDDNDNNNNDNEDNKDNNKQEVNPRPQEQYNNT